MCIHYWYHIHPNMLCSTSSHLHHCQTPTLGQNLFCSPVVIFWRGENIKDNRRNMVFLLVWDEDSCTGKFLVLFPCIYVLQPQLVHFYQSSLLLSSPLPMVAWTSLSCLYSFLYSKNINRTQAFGFLPLPYAFCAQPPLSATHVP
jgi:hypothetical protein